MRMANLILKWGTEQHRADARGGRWDFAPSGEEEREYAKRPRYVYFMQRDTDGPIKVGSAFDPEERLIELQVGSPEELHLLGAAWGPRLEPFLKRLLSPVHIRGEWFENVPLTRSVMTDPELNLYANSCAIWYECLAARGMRMVWRNGRGNELDVPPLTW